MHILMCKYVYLNRMEKITNYILMCGVEMINSINLIRKGVLHTIGLGVWLWRHLLIVDLLT